MHITFADLGKKMVEEDWGLFNITSSSQYFKKSGELQDIRCLLAALLKETMLKNLREQRLERKVIALKGVITRLKKKKDPK